MKSHLITGTVALLASAFLIQPASATAKKFVTNGSQRQCADLIKECFAYSDEERSDCFHAAGAHSFCAGSSLGTLAMKRWSMSPVRNPALDTAPAFLGPQVVDGECVNNFDNNWSGALVKGDYSADSLQSFETTLDSCNRKMPVDMMRP